MRLLLHATLAGVAVTLVVLASAGAAGSRPRPQP